VTRFQRCCCLVACAVSLTVLVSARVAAQAMQAVPVLDVPALRAPVALDGPWLVQAGDNPAYADPNFDDSHWVRFNAKTGSLRNLFPHSQPNIVWYRIHLKVTKEDAGIALLEYRTAYAFEIYSNGVKILKAGSVAPFSAADPRARLVARIPDDQIAAGSASRSVVLALRVYIAGPDWTQDVLPDLSGDDLVLGPQSSIEDRRWLRIIGERSAVWFQYLLVIALFLGALVLYSAQRRREYFYLALWTGGISFGLPWHTLGNFYALSWPWGLTITFSTFIGAWLLPHVYLAFVGRRIGWRLNLYALVAALFFAIGTMVGEFGGPLAPFYALFEAPTVLLISVIMPVELILNFRRGNRDAGIMLIPLFLLGLVADWILITDGLSHLPKFLPWVAANGDRFLVIIAGPFTIATSRLTEILSYISLALIVLLQSNRQSRKQAVLETALASARQVQQVILPGAEETVPGFRIESAYEPAQEVGGDFFQTIPDGGGGLLVVVGDVAGKGLPAAMLVSVLIGAIRTAAESTSAPDRILASLNRCLAGRTHGGFSTAIAAHVGKNGTVSIANAGHLSPYMDGREVELPGALPLGIDADASYETSTLQLTAGSRLVFYSDGVVEAQDGNGKLLGFERAQELSTQPAAEIAQTAKSFGQSDDITVVAVERQVDIASTAGDAFDDSVYFPFVSDSEVTRG
jgi:sigma-B regulation protein RsbU (phosphoserine phosphatase)